jgi:ribonuclease HII
MAEILVGIDEAGMGTLAGPLTAAIVVIKSDKVPIGVRDSKKLKEEKREELAALIMDAAEFFKVIAIPPEDIDKDGLSTSWRWAIRGVALAAHIVCNHKIGEEEYILDGNRLVGLPYVKPVVKADDKYPAVSAASILAKYTQCCWMDDYHKEFPAYGFDQHRGYGTANHLQKLKELGPCPIHRKSFKPVKKVL